MEDKICKHCKSYRLNKAGINKSGTNRYQRYYCRDCYRISAYKIEVEANPVKDLTPTTEKTNDTQQ